MPRLRTTSVPTRYRGHYRYSLPRLALQCTLLLLTAVVPTAAGLANGREQAELIELGWSSLVRQSTDRTCGPAVIATLSGWSGRPVSELAVAAHAALGDDGVTLAEFSRLARLFDVPGRWVWVEASARSRPLPPGTVIHLSATEEPFGHFAIVTGTFDGYVGLADPERGNLLLSSQRLLREWSGAAFIRSG